MNNSPFPSGSGGGPPTSYTPGPSFSSMPRRSSYASVVAAGSPQGPNHPMYSGALSNLVHSTPSNSYPPQYPSDNRHSQNSSALDVDMQGNGSGTAQPSLLGTLPSYSRRYASTLDYTTSSSPLRHHPPSSSAANTTIPPFFTPSYLTNSKYVAKLEAAHRAKQAAQKESSQNHNNNTTTSSTTNQNSSSLSASSSNVNLHRMAPSHRGMTYDIIEHHPPREEENLMPLPTKWNDADKCAELDLSHEGLEVRHKVQGQKEHDAAAVRADHPMPPQCGIYYFEVTILTKPKEGMIGVGFSSNKASLGRLPGWESESWGYHGDDGKSFFGESPSPGKPYGPTFTTNDTVGCGVNFATGCAFFTRNGVFLGNAFRELRNVKLYPSVGMNKQPGGQIRANFGQRPFMFDIDGMMKKEIMSIQKGIDSTDTSSLHSQLNEDQLIQELVAQFLTHDGYVETARAFAREVNEESKALKNGQGPPLKEYIEEDLDCINRQKIRTAILDGDIDGALKHTNAYYGEVLIENPQINFRLRCRKFIEMMRRCTELQAASAAKRGKSSNGAAAVANNDVFAEDMELDDEMHVEGDWGHMDMEETDYATKYQDLLQEAVLYGQELRLDYPGDEKKEYKKTLDDIFSLVAYDDPKSSVHGHFLETSGRLPVAEELNSAILAAQGKSSTPALERLYQQTEVLVNDISEEGGAGAFVNVRNDYL
ncbi:Ran-binding protein 9 [Arachnomyces sp. PD_36]|nr:Ran-binding protein 9 [Arachnomyces sp. PD_36]